MRRLWLYPSRIGGICKDCQTRIFCETQNDQTGEYMARPNYGFEKRRKQIAKQKKAEEKRQRRLAKRKGNAPDADAPAAPAEGDAPAAEGDAAPKPTEDE
jgi:hypothetical protein